MGWLSHREREGGAAGNVTYVFRVVVLKTLKGNADAVPNIAEGRAATVAAVDRCVYLYGQELGCEDPTQLAQQPGVLRACVLQARGTG